MDQVGWCTWILSGFFSVVAILGNATVLALISTRRKLHNRANCFVLSLALADLTFSALDMAALYYVLGSPLRGSERLAVLTAIIVLGSASVTNLCALTLDRYVAIVHPLRYVTIMKPRRVGCLIAAAWAVAALRPLVFTENSTPRRMVGMTLYQILPCIGLVITTARILTIVRRHSKQTAALSAQLRHNYPTARSRGCIGQNNRATPTREAISANVLVAVVTVFVACYGLGSLLVFIPHNQYILKSVHILLVLNSAANPIAYAFFKTDIKREMSTVLGCLKKNQSPLRSNLSERVSTIPLSGLERDGRSVVETNPRTINTVN